MSTSAFSLSSSLDGILNVQKAKELDVDSLKQVWLSKKHLAKDNLCAVVPNEQYDTLEKLALENPNFVLPTNNIATKQMDIHYIQWQKPASEPNTLTCLITLLADFQALGLRAEPHSVIFFYKDLSESHGVVLMKGEVVVKRKLSIESLEFLVLNIQKFYGVMDQDNATVRNQRLTCLRNFTKGGAEFDFNELLRLSVNLH